MQVFPTLRTALSLRWRPLPDKPKGMHNRTYRRLFLEYKQAHEEFTRVNDEYARKLIANQERLTGRAFKGLEEAS